MARRDFQLFTERIAVEPEPQLHHRYLIAKLQDVADGYINRLMVFMPPGSAKSTYASVLYPPWYLGRHEDGKVITASYGQKLSRRFGKKARNILYSDEYRAIFGYGLSGGNAAKDEWETEVGGEYTATSVDGSVTGRRAGVIIIDDPIKGRKEADSEVTRETCWEWYRTDMRSRLLPGGAIVIIQTRWHEDDLSGRILPEDYDGKSGRIAAKDGEIWEVVCLRAEAEENDPLGRKPGQILWPEWFSKEQFDQERISQGPRNWNALYQQRPAPEEGDYFKSEWLRYYDEQPANMQIYGASDYAVTADGGDYTVHMVFGIDPNDDIYLLDLFRAQTTSDVWVEQFIELVQKWKPLEWAEEMGQIEKGVGPFIEKRQREEQAYCYRRGFSSATDKPTRAQAIRGRMAQGKVYFPKNAPWTAKLVSELLIFPAGANDDQVDVLSLIGRMLADMSKGTVPKKPEKAKFEMDMTIQEMIDARTRKRKAAEW